MKNDAFESNNMDDNDVKKTMKTKTTIMRMTLTVVR